MSSRGTSVGTFVGGTQLGTWRIWRVEEKSKELNLKITFPFLAASQPAPCLGSENLKTKQNRTKKAGGTDSRGANRPGEESKGGGRHSLVFSFLHIMREQTENLLPSPLPSSLLSCEGKDVTGGSIYCLIKPLVRWMVWSAWGLIQILTRWHLWAEGVHAAHNTKACPQTESSFLAVWCSASYLTSLTLSILLCKMAAGIGNTSSCDCED